MTDLSSELASLRIDRSAPPPRGSGVRWLVVAAVVLGGGWYAATLLSSAVFKTEVESTEIRMISPAHAAVLVTSTGYLVPQVTSKVGARAFGRVAEVFVHEGDTVEAGAPLARLDDAEQRAAIAAARARLSAARARVETARATLGETRLQHDRESSLVKSGAVAPSVAEDLGTKLRTLQATVDAALADVGTAEADLAQLELNLSFMTVTAPIAGTVTADPAQPGELVGPATVAIVADLADLTTLTVETDVPEARLAQITVGGPAEIVLDAFPTVRQRGRVVGINPRVNRAKATAVVKVAFLDPVPGVLPEMAARVSFLSAELDAEAAKVPPKLFVPGSAVVERDGAQVVFRLNEGRAALVPVTLGGPIGEGFELLSGPPDGTKVIAHPPDELQDGYPVSEQLD